MNVFSVNGIFPESECDFLNDCGIELRVVPKSPVQLFDYQSDSQVLDSTDTVYFYVTDEADETLLRLKFGDRLFTEVFSETKLNK